MRTLVCFFVVIGVAAADESVLIGTPVSQPLQPVTLPEPPPQPVPPPPKVEEAKEPVRAVRPSSYSSYDLLMWWTKTQPIPALVTASTSTAPPILGSRDTVLLVGGNSLSDAMTAGFRFTMGWNAFSCNNEALLGFEFSGTFLGTRVSKQTFSDSMPGDFTAIGRPYVDARTGQPAVLLASTGAVSVATTTRVQGWEVNLTHNLVDAGDVTVTALGGYRAFQVNEGLHVKQSSLRFPAPGAPPNVLWTLYDQFDARNNFHGAQIGLKIDSTLGRWLFGFRGTIAYGTNFETVHVQGGSSATTPALPLPAVQHFGAGFLAVNSNIGRGLQSEYAVLPEGRLNFGFCISENCHLSAGYDFIYLSDSVRPGDQIDLVIDPSRSPIANTGAPFGPNRPRVAFARSDFWVQGITLGLDYRY